MKSGKCPKCGNNDIAAIKRPAMTSTMTGNILGEHIPLGCMKGIALIQHYVCRQCGYLEHYIIDEHIEKV